VKKQILFLSKRERLETALKLNNLIVDMPHIENVDVHFVDDKPEDIDFSQFDFGISYFYPHILKPEHWEALTYKAIVNCHIGYLPYNRGSYPAAWSIIEDTPAGVTMHIVDEGIDTGPILWRRLVPKFPQNTGKTLYDRLSLRMEELLLENFPRILLDPWILQSSEHAIPQREFPEYMHDGVTRRDAHRKASFENIRDLYRGFYRDKLPRTIRACSFPNGYAYFEDDEGNRTYVKAVEDGNFGR
jgi:methionyl-tRNA formyltransferase